MIQDKLEKVIESFCDENGDITCEEGLQEAVKELFNQMEVKYVDNIEEMFDSPGMDVYSYSIAWEENDKINMITYRICFC